MNKAILVGHLGANPVLRYTAGGSPVCEMSVATNHAYADKQGNKISHTEWHHVVVWGRLGESCAKYLSKGRGVLVEGRIQTRTWEDKHGRTHYMTEVIASAVEFLGRGQGKPAPDRQAPPREEPRQLEPEPEPAPAGLFPQSELVHPIVGGDPSGDPLL